MIFCGYNSQATSLAKPAKQCGNSFFYFSLPFAMVTVATRPQKGWTRQSRSGRTLSGNKRKASKNKSGFLRAWKRFVPSTFVPEKVWLILPTPLAKVKV
jgi:hypothetical protein